MTPKNNMDAFFEKAEANNELREKVAAIFQDSAKRTAEALASLSQATGAPFSAEDFLARPSENGVKTGQPLSDENLGAISGGVSIWETNTVALGIIGSLLGGGGLAGASNGALALGKLLASGDQKTSIPVVLAGGLGDSANG